MMTWQSHLVQTGSHIIGVYPNEKAKLDAAFEFLKDGLFRNETVMLITDSMPQAKIIKEMASQWNVDAETSALLMDGFYVALLTGLEVPAALQQSARRLREHHATDHPYYWAGFQTYGAR